MLRDAVSGSQFPLPLHSLALSFTVPLDHIRSLLPFPSLSHSCSLSNSPPSPFWRHLRSSFSHNSSQHTVLSLPFFPMLSLFSHYPPLPAHPEDVSPFKNNQRLPSLPLSPTAPCFIIPRSRFPSCFKSLTQTSGQAQQCLPLGYSCQAFQLARTLPHNSWHGATNRNKLGDSGRGDFIPLEGYHRLSLL